MHEILVTKAMVIRKEPEREVDVLVTLFTERFGLIRARSGGLRSLQSKLRATLHEFSLIEVSLINGRGGWRITTAVLEAPLYTPLAALPERLKTAARVVVLLLRLCTGEEPDPNLFKIVCGGLRVLGEAEASACSSMEVLMILRMLQALGYIKVDPELVPFVGEGDFGTELRLAVWRKRSFLIKEINQALKASEL